jgi:hypothetical protein
MLINFMVTLAYIVLAANIQIRLSRAIEVNLLVVRNIQIYCTYISISHDKLNHSSIILINGVESK